MPTSQIRATKKNTKKKKIKQNQITNNKTRNKNKREAERNKNKQIKSKISYKFWSPKHRIKNKTQAGSENLLKVKYQFKRQ